MVDADKHAENSMLTGNADCVRCVRKDVFMV